MADIIDSLVTQLEYDADTKVLDAADKKLKQLEKQSQKTAKATDDLTDEQIRLKTKLQDTAEAEQKLRREQAKLRREIKAAKKPTDAQVKALKHVDQQLEATTQSSQKLRNELSRLGIQQAKLNRQQRATTRQQSRLGGARQAAGKRAAEAGPGALSMEGLATAAAPVTAALGAVTVAAVGAGTAIATIVETGARMETLRARLKTVEGSAEQAAQSFSLLRSIATETPFELEDVTNAYVRLKSLGIQPTEKALKAFGNVSAAQGKPIIDFIEAVADASTGEFERLKEFGIKASSQGEQVAFTFGGLTTRVGKNAGEITRFLENLGETQFAGAMEDQMNTFAGLVSNLKDRWTNFLDQISQLGVLDEVKLIIKEISGVMGDDLAPIIAEVVVNLLQQLRELIVFLRGDSEDLTSRFEGLADTFNLVMTILQPFIALWKVLVSVLGLFVDTGTESHGVVSRLLEILGRALDTIVLLISPTQELTGEWGVLADVWGGVTKAGDLLVGTVNAAADALFNQAGSLQSVNQAIKEFQELTGTDGIKTKTDAELQAMRRKGGKQAERADAEINRRIKAREEEEQRGAEDARRKKRKEDQSARAGDFTKDFSKASDRQLAAFVNDPNVSQKLRDKAVKEQEKREKKRRKEGAAASKKLAGATLVASVNKQIDKNARELAQAEAARGLRSGKLTAATAGSFETRRFKEIGDEQRAAFNEQGRLPAGIAQGVRQIAALPSINDLAGRTAPPVISNTINKFEFRDNEIIAQVMGGEFATSPGEVATLSAPALSKELFKLLGQAVPNFRTQEVR